MGKFTIRCESSQFLTITVLGRSHPGCSDYWDGNWLRAAVEVDAGSFRGTVSGDLRAEELAEFGEELARLQVSLKGEVVFETMERWLSIRVAGDGRGHMEFRCVVGDQDGPCNSLECLLATDQTFTRSTVAELASIVQEFPVVGHAEC